MSDEQPKAPRQRRVVIVECDVTQMAGPQVAALLLAIASCRDVSFRVELLPGVISGVLTDR